MKSLINKMNTLLEDIESAMETREDREGDKADRERDALYNLQCAIESARDDFEGEWTE